MKNFIVALFVAFCTSANAQVFNHIEKMDKFDDVVYSKTAKSLISFNDSIIVIEEKGKPAMQYDIINYADYNSMGSKGEIVNLVGNVYGYQDCWCVIKHEDAEAYGKIVSKYILEAFENEGNASTDELGKYWLWITHRVVTSQYAHTFLSEYWWVSDKDDNRVIYSNE